LVEEIKKMTTQNPFKLTYATMFNPPEELHQRFDQVLKETNSNLGRDYGMWIEGKDHFSKEKFEDCSPTNKKQVLAVFQKGSAEDAALGLSSARRAFPGWSRTPWQERVRLLREAARLMDERIFEFGVVMALEVGKNRMESLGDASETADLIRYACDRMEASDGYITEMGRDPLTGFTSRNVSILRPYGVWVVISPFNFPCALTGGPAAAALVTGNTLVMKPATDTPWTARLLADCFRDAGIPAGVFNFVTGPGSTLGQALIDNQEIDGITFTGSFDVGMQLYRDFSNGKFIRPTILELGGKNPAIVSHKANLDIAAQGIIRSAYGLQGQKCSACSRILIEKDIYQPMVDRLVDLTSKLKVGDPTLREITTGPVINQAAYQDYQSYVDEIREFGRILAGGHHLTEGSLYEGYFCAPTLAELPLDHHLWKQEMFLPISTVARVSDLDQAMIVANEVNYGLTAGFYGSEEEAKWFYENIEAGVTYVNRPQGATTGAWPGYQPFGGWKGSGATGKNAGGLYYLPLYMREQIQNRVSKG
jgi:1-pyrroline-5-carboxylate dehydrogenase